MIEIGLTIAGSDSGGGAGIQADLKTFSALGVYGASVLTALTAQNTLGVSAVHDVPAEFVAAQIDAVYGDLAVKATKIGMLSQPAIIETVAAGLASYETGPVVLDPVMVAASGDPLIADDAVDVLAAAQKAADEVFDDLSQKGESEAAIIASYRAARQQLQPWSKVSQAALLAARDRG